MPPLLHSPTNTSLSSPHSIVPYVLLMILGNFIVAFGYERKWPWEVIVVIGYACAGVQVAALPAMATTYAVDSYKPVAGSLMVAITVNKNVWGYGFSEFITPWVERSGFVSFLSSFFVPPLPSVLASLFSFWEGKGEGFFLLRAWLARLSRRNERGVLFACLFVCLFACLS